MFAYINQYFLQHRTVQILLGVLTGLCLAGFLAVFAGESFVRFFAILGAGVFGTPYDFGITLYYVSILLLSGLAVTIPIRAGLFNIGAEGQILLGALTTVFLGLSLPAEVPRPVILSIIVFGAALSGALWAALAGLIRAYRGGHEVISTIMLNFVAAGFTNWVTIQWMQDPNDPSPVSRTIDPSLMLDRIAVFQDAPVTKFLFFGIFVSILTWVMMTFTTFGFRQNVVRSSEKAARVSGINVPRIQWVSMFLGGSLAGVAGAVMVLAFAGKFRLGMAEGFGFMGIPVALLASGHAIAGMASAFLFAFLHHGSAAFDLESEFVTRDMVYVMQALIVLSVIGVPVLISRFIEIRRKKNGVLWNT
jgi:ABC-type uncharacterized transport system permease subunit